MFRHRPLDNRPHTGHSLTRSRWAAVGAAVAVTVGGGGLVGVSAAGDDASGSLFTAVSPVRMLDTRSQSMVGALDGSGAPLRLQITGDRVPAGAESVSMNVTVVDGRATAVGGFVTVYPCDIPRPDTSNLNFVDGQTVPNAVTVPLAADGSVCFHVYGRAHLLADVMGYHGDARLTAIESELGRLRNLSASEGGDTPIDLGAYATRAETDDMIDTAIAGVRADMPAPVDLSGHATRAETDDMIHTAVDTAVAGVRAAAGPVAPTAGHGRVIDAVGRLTHRVAPWTSGGHEAALTIGADGLPIIAHHDTGSGSVLVTRCDDALCGTASTVNTGRAGGADGLDITLGDDGLPIIAYATGGPASSLATVACTTPSCSTYTVRTHAAGTTSGIDPAITVGVSGQPFIAHILNGHLAIARCNDRTCQSASHLWVGDSGPDASDPTITVRPDGIPEIAVTTPEGLRLVTCADTACSDIGADRLVATAGPGLSAVGLTPSITIDTDGRVRIAHQAVDGDGLGTLLLTTCADTACTTSLTEPVDGGAGTHSVGHSPTMVIAADGTPTIVHVHRSGDGTPRLRITTIDSTGSAASADTHIDARAATATLDADGALVSALRMDAGDVSTLGFHRRVHRSWTANGWGD
ncbi:MAG: hypothetical protein RIR49_13 [Actinomycetota bacterium]